MPDLSYNKQAWHSRSGETPRQTWVPADGPRIRDRVKPDETRNRTPYRLWVVSGSTNSPGQQGRHDRVQGPIGVAYEPACTGSASRPRMSINFRTAGSAFSKMSFPARP